MGFDSVKEHQQFNDGKLSKHAVFSQPGLCMVDVYCARPGQLQPVHGHAHATKCYAVIEGRARITIGDDVREAGPGDLAFAPLGVAHGIEALGPGNLTALVFIAGTL